MPIVEMVTEEKWELYRKRKVGLPEKEKEKVKKCIGQDQ